jgi:hypothetical protein
MGRPAFDMTGMRYGKFTVLRLVGPNERKALLWECRCDCGTVVTVIGGNLRSGQSKSCGCERISKVRAAGIAREGTPSGPRKDLTGEIFNRWTVLGRVDGDKWQCRCQCGTERNVDGGNLRFNRSKSCGCLQKEITSNLERAHHMSEHPIYECWTSMKKRCLNPNNKDWKHYGGRGIKVCKRWMKFANFLEDMFATWAPGLEIDRYPDNNGDYEPGNVRWTWSNGELK